MVKNGSDFTKLDIPKFCWVHNVIRANVFLENKMLLRPIKSHIVSRMVSRIPLYKMLTIFLFSVGVPCLDQFTDVSMVLRLFRGPEDSAIINIGKFYLSPCKDYSWYYRYTFPNQRYKKWEFFPANRTSSVFSSAGKVWEVSIICIKHIFKAYRFFGKMVMVPILLSNFLSLIVSFILGNQCKNSKNFYRCILLYWGFRKYFEYCLFCS